jgi:H+/Cl- antiporter ClcA
MDAKARREMDRYSYLIDRQHGFLLIGIVVLLLAVVFTLTGESVQGWGLPIVSRAEEPKRFWWAVALFYLTGIFFIALYLFKISN